jgi:hypothetical protein
VSSNWSGYAVTGATGTANFTDVAGTWTVPRLACSKTKGTSSAFWVGIGGFSSTSSTLQQLGSSADCNPGGTTSYRLWTEIVPAPAHFLKMKVRPGDRVTAAVVVNGRSVVLSMKNQTLGTRYSTRVVSSIPLDTSSAEWIAEAPSLCRTSTQCQVVPLSNFGTVGFTNAAATANGHTGTILDPAWTVTPLALVTSSGAPNYITASNPYGAVPNAIDPTGRAFTVSFRPTFRGTVPASPLAGAPLPSWIR